MCFEKVKDGRFDDDLRPQRKGVGYRLTPLSLRGRVRLPVAVKRVTRPGQVFRIDLSPPRTPSPTSLVRNFIITDSPHHTR